MLEQIAEAAQAQSWDAWTEAQFDNCWHTEVIFKRWGFADRYLETAGQWIPF